jgi:hypothetical protein
MQNGQRPANLNPGASYIRVYRYGTLLQSCTANRPPSWNLRYQFTCQG